MTQSTSRRRQSQPPAVVVTGGGRMGRGYLDRYLRARTACEIVTALLPNEIFQQIEQRPVPLVICDDTAPSMRDFRLMRDIKALSPKTQVILLVPGGSFDQERRAKAAGADACVPYTFALRRLPIILDDLFASRSSVTI